MKPHGAYGPTGLRLSEPGPAMKYVEEASVTMLGHARLVCVGPLALKDSKQHPDHTSGQLPHDARVRRGA